MGQVIVKRGLAGGGGAAEESREQETWDDFHGR
jgi:hypothetical protein